MNSRIYFVEGYKPEKEKIVSALVAAKEAVHVKVEEGKSKEEALQKVCYYLGAGINVIYDGPAFKREELTDLVKDCPIVQIGVDVFLP